MKLLHKAENQYPTHFWINAKSLKTGVFLGAILSIKRAYKSVVSTMHSLIKNFTNISVCEDIKNKKYEIVIYGSYHRGMPYYDLVNEIILLCGEDIHWWCDCNHYVERGAPCICERIIRGLEN